MDNRNLYNDNIFDINSIDDIKNVNSIALLEKTNNRILFELGNDFFKYDSNSEKLYQYPDFLSLKSNKNPKEITELDYGFVISDSLNNSAEIDLVKNFELRDRESYIKKDLHEGLFNIPVNIAESIKRRTDKIKNTVAVKSPELKDINHTINALLDTMSLFYCYYKAIKIRTMKHKVVDLTLAKLTQDNAGSIIKDPELLKQVPELREVIKKARDFDVNFKVSDESAFKYQTSRVNNLVDYAFGNAELMQACEKVADTNLYQEHLSNIKSKFDEFYNNINDEFPVLKDALVASSEKNYKILKEFSRPDNPEIINIYKEQKINPQDPTSNLEFLLANHFFSKSLSGNDDDDYLSSISSIVSDTKSFNKVSVDRVYDIVEKLSDKIFQVDLDQKTNISLKH